LRKAAFSSLYENGEERENRKYFKRYAMIVFIMRMKLKKDSRLTAQKKASLHTDWRLARRPFC
jgi:hypothetical protein